MVKNVENLRQGCRGCVICYKKGKNLLTNDGIRAMIILLIEPTFATDGNVEHHKETKNVIADRLGAFD